MSDSKLGTRPAHFLPFRNLQRLYSSVSFYNQTFGQTFNTHVVIQYEGLGIMCPRAAAAFHSRFNQQVNRWLCRQACSSRWAFQDWEHAYVYVHENARDKGLHTHELLWIPPGLRAVFEVWVQDWVAAWANRHGEAYLDKAVYAKVKHFRSETGRVAIQWRWFRYLSKSLQDIVLADDDGCPVRSSEILKLERTQPTWPTGCAQQSGASRNISCGRINVVGMQVVDKWTQLYTGWELEVYRDRIRAPQIERQLQSLDI